MQNDPLTFPSVTSTPRNLVVGREPGGSPSRELVHQSSRKWAEPETPTVSWPQTLLHKTDSSEEVRTRVVTSPDQQNCLYIIHSQYGCKSLFIIVLHL